VTSIDQVLFVLASASQGIKAETALRAAGIQAALIPVPRTLSSTCGVCLRVAGPDRESAETVLSDSRIDVSAVHEIAARSPETATTKGEVQ
jgi:hypothetical protein